MSEGTYEHEGEEFLHILSGSLEFALDGDKFFVLRAGDSYYFESAGDTTRQGRAP